MAGLSYSKGTHTIAIPFIMNDPYQTTTSTTYADMDFASWPFDPTMFKGSILSIKFQALVQQTTTTASTVSAQLWNNGTGAVVTGTPLTSGSLGQFVNATLLSADIKANLTQGPQNYHVMAKVTTSGATVAVQWAAIIVTIVV